MMAPKVSILVPNYNYGQFLAETIESVLEQEFQDYEIVVIDNGSTDDSRAVIERFAGRDGRLRTYFNDRNIGAAENWNRCLEQARAEYIKYLFSDDRFTDSHALGRMVAMLDRHPAVVLVASAVRVVDERLRLLHVRDPFGRTLVAHGPDISAHCLTHLANLIGEPSAVMFRRRQAGRGFSLEYTHMVDLEMWIHLLEQGDFAYIAEPLCDFRNHPYRPALKHAAGGLARTERARLTREYFSRAWMRQRLTRQRLFTTLYYFSKRHGGDADEIGIDKGLLASLGPGWYAACWLRHRIGRLVGSCLPARARHSFDRPRGIGSGMVV